MNNYIIYMHKNKINGKVYIGQTCQKPEYRWGKEGNGYKQCPLFYNAIQKYGWNNFEHIILKTGLASDEANLMEKYYIKKFNSIDPKFGYNLSKGGDNREVQHYTSKKISDRLKQEWTNGTRDKEEWSIFMKEKWENPEYRKKQKEARKNLKITLSEEGRKRISEARKEYIKKYGTPTQGKGHTEKTRKILSEQKKGEKNPMYGKHHTQEWKDMMKEKHSKKIKCIETQQIFNSYKEATEWCGNKSSSGLSDYFAGRKKSFGKHPITKEKLHWEKVLC